MPAAVVLPIEDHHMQGARIKSQAAASRPTRKRLWPQAVKAKITAQAAALKHFGASPVGLNHMVGRARSGDPNNVEAQAAQRYWPALFGKGFHRDQSADGANALLNYGYPVLRMRMAQARCLDAIHDRIARLVGNVPARECQNYLQNAGYDST